jgi:hypothetical protein
MRQPQCDVRGLFLRLIVKHVWGEVEWLVQKAVFSTLHWFLVTCLWRISFRLVYKAQSISIYVPASRCEISTLITMLSYLTSAGRVSGLYWYVTSNSILPALSGIPSQRRRQNQSEQAK